MVELSGNMPNRGAGQLTHPTLHFSLPTWLVLPPEEKVRASSHGCPLMHKNMEVGEMLGLCSAKVPAHPAPLPLLNCPGLPQDVADFEWVMWFTSFRNVIVFALSGHVLFAKLCTMVAPQVS